MHRRFFKLGLNDGEPCEANLGQRVVVGRSGELLLLGNRDAAVRRAIDAQSGPSLADDAAMNELFDALPDGRAATVYLSPNLFDEILGGLATLGGVGLVDVPETGVGATAMSLTLTDDGVQADLVTQVPEDDAASSLAGQAAVTAGSETLPDLLPADTFLYLGFGGDGDGGGFDSAGLDEFP